VAAEEARPAESRLNAGQWTALSVLGFLYLRLGHWDRAERLFKALAALRPGDVQTAASLAAAALGRGDWAAALERVEKILAGRAPAASDTYLHLMKAQALWRLGRTGEAEAEAARCLAAAPGPKEDRP
jgi:predicted Zn-dependent protease